MYACSAVDMGEHVAEVKHLEPQFTTHHVTMHSCSQGAKLRACKKNLIMVKVI